MNEQTRQKLLTYTTIAALIVTGLTLISAIDKSMTSAIIGTVMMGLVAVVSVLIVWIK